MFDFLILLESVLALFHCFPDFLALFNCCFVCLIRSLRARGVGLKVSVSFLLFDLRVCPLVPQGVSGVPSRPFCPAIRGQ